MKCNSVSGTDVEILFRVITIKTQETQKIQRTVKFRDWYKSSLFTEAVREEIELLQKHWMFQKAILSVLISLAF